MSLSAAMKTLLTGTAIAVALSTAASSDHKVSTPVEAKNGLFKPGYALAANTLARSEVEKPVPIFDGLGSTRFNATTKSELAQTYFDQGLAWTYGFNHEAARQAFRAAQSADPTCAMCFWGEAYVLGPNINDPMHDDAAGPAFTAVAVAKALKAGATPKEQQLIDALARRYSADPEAERAALDKAYADAMGEVAKAYLDDADIQALYAEALMNLQPWDYWEADKKTPKGQGGEIVAVLERALKLDKTHPHAIHLYIHAVEASSDPHRAEPHADRLAALMPGSGHLVHMPAHIYFRVGRYRDSFITNKAAVKADETYFEKVSVNPDGIYPFGYYPHNVHYMLVSAQMAGAKEDAIAAAEKLGSVISDDVAKAIPWVQAIKTAPYTAHAQFSDPDTILSIADPGNRFPMVKAFWHYARGIGHLRGGDLTAAIVEVRALEKILKSADFSSLVAAYVPAPDLLNIAKLVLEGRVARARGDMVTAVAAFEQAAKIQDTIPYMEPPYWYYPVRQTLAATHLMNGHGEKAETLFQASLDESPNNGWALYGLLRCQEATGQVQAAAKTRAKLDSVWLGERALLEIERL